MAENSGVNCSVFCYNLIEINDKRKEGEGRDNRFDQ